MSDNPVLKLPFQPIVSRGDEAHCSPLPLVLVLRPRRRPPHASRITPQFCAPCAFSRPISALSAFSAVNNSRITHHASSIRNPPPAIHPSTFPKSAPSGPWTKHGSLWLTGSISFSPHSTSV